MGAIASQITSLTIVYSTVYSDADQRKHQSSAALAFVRGIHRGPVNSPQKWPVTRKIFPFDDVIMFVVYLNRMLHSVFFHYCHFFFQSVQFILQNISTAARESLIMLNLFQHWVGTGILLAFPNIDLLIFHSILRINLCKEVLGFNCVATTRPVLHNLYMFIMLY